MRRVETCRPTADEAPRHMREKNRWYPGYSKMEGMLTKLLGGATLSMRQLFREGVVLN